MLLRIFKSNMPIIIILILLTAAGLWIKSFMGALPKEFAFDIVQMPLYRPLIQLFDNSRIGSTILAFVLIVLMGFTLVRLNTIYIFINQRTNLPALFYILIASSLPALNRLNPVIFSAFLLVLAIGRMLGTYRQDGLSYNYFEAAFYISVGSLFYINLGFFIVLTWVGLILFRPFVWREWLFTLIGFALPYLFLFAYYFIMGIDVGDRLINLYNNITVSNGQYYLTGIYLIFLGYLTFVILLASYFMIQKFPTIKIHARRSFLLFLWVFIICVMLFAFIPSVSLDILLIAAIPVAFISTHYFLFTRSKRWSELFFIVFVLLLILVNVMK